MFPVILIRPVYIICFYRIDHQKRDAVFHHAAKDRPGRCGLSAPICPYVNHMSVDLIQVKFKTVSCICPHIQNIPQRHCPSCSGRRICCEFNRILSDTYPGYILPGKAHHNRQFLCCHRSRHPFIERSENMPAFAVRHIPCDHFRDRERQMLHMFHVSCRSLILSELKQTQRLLVCILPGIDRAGSRHDKFYRLRTVAENVDPCIPESHIPSCLQPLDQFVQKRGTVIYIIIYMLYTDIFTAGNAFRGSSASKKSPSKGEHISKDLRPRDAGKHRTSKPESGPEARCCRDQSDQRAAKAQAPADRTALPLCFRISLTFCISRISAQLRFQLVCPVQNLFDLRIFYRLRQDRQNVFRLSSRILVPDPGCDLVQCLKRIFPFAKTCGRLTGDHSAERKSGHAQFYLFFVSILYTGSCDIHSDILLQLVHDNIF